MVVDDNDLVRLWSQVVSTYVINVWGLLMTMVWRVYDHSLCVFVLSMCDGCCWQYFGAFMITDCEYLRYLCVMAVDDNALARLWSQRVRTCVTNVWRLLMTMFWRIYDHSLCVITLSMCDGCWQKCFGAFMIAAGAYSHSQSVMTASYDASVYLRPQFVCIYIPKVWTW